VFGLTEMVAGCVTCRVFGSTLTASVYSQNIITAINALATSKIFGNFCKGSLVCASCEAVLDVMAFAVSGVVEENKKLWVNYRRSALIRHSASPLSIPGLCLPGTPS
jgi:hypothetical protein